MGRRTAPNARTDAPVAALGVRRGNVNGPWGAGQSQPDRTRAHVNVSEPERLCVESWGRVCYAAHPS